MAQQPGALDAAAILRGIGQMLGTFSSQEAQIVNNSTETKKILANAGAESAQAASDASTVMAAEQAGILQKQARNRETLAALDWDNQRVAVASTLNEKGAILARLDAEIAKADSVAFTDNPIMWIGAQLSKQGKVEEFNATARSYNLAEQHMSSLNSMAQQTAATAAATIEKSTAASAAAASRNAGSAFRLQEMEMHMKALAQDTATLDVLRKGKVDALNIQLNAFNLSRGEEKWKMELQDRAERRKLFGIQLQNAEAESKLKGQEFSYQENILKLANAGAAHIGRRPFMSYVDFKTFQTSSKSGADDAQKFIEWGYEKLDTAQNKGGLGFVQLGATPADAAITVARTRGTFPDAKNDKILRSITEDALSGKLGDSKGSIPTGADLKNQDVVEGIINHHISVKYNSDKMDVSAGGTSNWFAPPTAHELVAAATDPVSKKLPFKSKLWRDLVAPIAAGDPNFQVSPENLFNIGLKAVQQGRMKPEEVAAGMYELGHAAVGVINASRNFRSIGLPPLTTFNSKVKTPGSFSSQDVDPTNYSNTLHQLVRESVRTQLAGRLQFSRNADSVITPAPPYADIAKTSLSGLDKMAEQYGKLAVGGVSNSGVRAAAGGLNPISGQDVTQNIQALLSRGDPATLQAIASLGSLSPETLQQIVAAFPQFSGLMQNSSVPYQTTEPITNTVAPFYPLGE